MHYSSSLRLSAVLVNVAAFVAAALALYELSRRVLKDERLAYKSALYFCVSPASIFFSAAYTESLHAALSFAAMLKVCWLIRGLPFSTYALRGRGVSKI